MAVSALLGAEALWKRYLVTNSIFVMLAMKEMLRGPKARSRCWTKKSKHWRLAGIELVSSLSGVVASATTPPHYFASLN